MKAGQVMSEEGSQAERVGTVVLEAAEAGRTRIVGRAAPTSASRVKVWGDMRLDSYGGSGGRGGDLECEFYLVNIVDCEF